MQDPMIVQRALGSLDRIVSYAKDPSTLCGEIHLTSEESYVLSRVDGHSSVANIIAISPIAEKQTLQCLYGLLSVGVLELGKKTRELAPTRKSIHSPGIPQPSSIKGAAAGVDDLSPEERWIRQDILAKSESLERGSYYDWLEVNRTAGDGEIKKSYHSLIKTYHPDRLYSKDLENLKGNLEGIVSKITSAYDVVSDPVARRRYDNSLRTEAPRGEDLSPRQKTTATPKKTNPEDAEKNTAEQYYKEAKKHFAEGEYHLTAELLDVSLRLDPANSRYHKLQGRALAKNPNWTKDAEEHFLTVLASDPSDIECLVGLGEVYEAAGLARKAERMYFRALGLDPGNEALKDKLLAKKQSPKWMNWLKILQH
jgi:tetratricopeptide (TPR) repeat protein